MEQPIEKKYTYADYLALGEKIRAELIDGELHMMSPSPSRKHQYTAGKLYWQIEDFLRDKPCEVYIAPFDVRLFEKDNNSDDETDTVVQPDISVICDKSKLDDRGCKGAPDLIIEILSPSSISHDRFVKLNLYQQAKVREYWIVSPFERSVEVLLLDEDGKFTHAGAYSKDEKAKVNVLPGCEIDLSKVFPEEEN